MFYQTVRFVVTISMVAGIASAGFAQNGKMIKPVTQALTRSAGEEAASVAVKNAGQATVARNLAQTAAASRQLQFQFAGDPVQLELPFAAENAAVQSGVQQAVSQKMEDLARKPLSATAALTIPSGETVRLVKLEAKHFKKTHKINSTIGHLLGVTKNPVVLVSQKTGEKITVFKNDRLRYFADLQQVCPEGSYLIRHENGKSSFIPPEKAPQSLVEAYEKVYKKNNPSDFLEVSFLPIEDSKPSIPEIKTLASLFTGTSSLAQIYKLDRHPVNGESVEAAVLNRPVKMEGLPDLHYKSVVVRYPDGSFDVHPADRVPPVLQEKIEAVSYKNTEAVKVELNDLSAGYRVYNSQSELAKALYSAAPEQGKAYSNSFLGDFLAYEIPPGIFYKPEGRSGEFLDPARQIIIYFPGKNSGQLVERRMLEMLGISFPGK